MPLPERDQGRRIGCSGARDVVAEGEVSGRSSVNAEERGVDVVAEAEEVERAGRVAVELEPDPVVQISKGARERLARIRPNCAGTRSVGGKRAASGTYLIDDESRNR